jgi:hypothetical protein
VEKTVQPGGRAGGRATDENIIRHMRFACWVKDGYKHLIRIRKTYCFSKEKLFRGRASVLCYTQIACCVFVFAAVYFDFPSKCGSGLF